VAPPWDARALPPEGEVGASRASLLEAVVAGGPPAWPREEEATERAAAMGAQHAGAAAGVQHAGAVGVALPASPGPLAELRAWPREAAAEESRASRAAARPSAAASACHQDQVLPWPARPRSARLARAIRSLRSASP